MKRGALITLILCPSFLLGQWTPPYNPDADLDGLIGAGDLLSLLGNFGVNWPQPIGGCTYAEACNYSTEAEMDDGSCILDGPCENEDLDEGHWVKFQVDMSAYSGTFNGVFLNGSFNGWCGYCTAMSDMNGDGIYTRSLMLEPGTYEYKFTVDGWALAETFDGSEPCTSNLFGYINRTLTIGIESTALSTVCWNSCSPCPNSTLTPPPSVCDELPGRPLPSTIEGTQLMDGETALHLKGVCWAPTPIGAGPPGNYFGQFAEQDAAMMGSLGINAVRTFGPISDEAVLDALWAEGIHVLMTVFYGYNDDVYSALSNVCAVKDHPAILGWLVGNEWNYTNLNQTPEIELSEAVAIVDEVTKAIKANDPSRVVSSVWGNLPPIGIIDELPAVDIWGTNVYWGWSFGDLFDQWTERSGKPLYLSEYGCDAYDGVQGEVDEFTQSALVESLTQEIFDQASVVDLGPCAGGMVFEWNDEWWKSTGSWLDHDVTSTWTNGAYPDPNMHEEWWGMVEINRSPRMVLGTYGAMVPPSP